MNNYYEYQFSKAKYIDFFITATDIQNHMVCRQFEQYQGYRPRVYTIPVEALMHYHIQHYQESHMR